MSIVLGLVLLASTSWASELARVQVAADVPFSAQQLASALALRTTKVPPRIQVTASDRPGHVLIVVNGSHRAVDIATLAGPEAARRVALVTLDLLEVAARAPARSVAAVTIGLPPEIHIEVPRPVLPIVRQPLSPALLISMSAVISNGGQGGSLSASVPVFGSMRGAVSVGIVTSTRINDLRVAHVPLSVAVERRWQWHVVALTSQVGMLVAPHRIGVDDGGARLGASGVRYGVRGAVAGDVPLTRSVRARLAGHVDSYLTQKQYLVGGSQVLMTERVAFALTFGLAVAVGGAR